MFSIGSCPCCVGVTGLSATAALLLLQQLNLSAEAQQQKLLPGQYYAFFCEEFWHALPHA